MMAKNLKKKLSIVWRHMRFTKFMWHEKCINGSFGHFIEKVEHQRLNYSPTYTNRRASLSDFSAGLGLNKVLFAATFYLKFKPAIN